MKIMIGTIGQPKKHTAKVWFDEYIKRLGTYHKIQVIHFKDDVDDKKIITVVKDQFCVVTDEHGKEFSSEELSRFLENKAVHGIGEMCFLVGGPNGHTPAIKARADLSWSFGKLTLPHDLATVVLAEALYRASSIQAGHPYHRP